MKRILYIFPTLNPGGAEKAAIRVANGLVQDYGYEITFFVYDDSDYYRNLIHPSITVVQLNRYVNTASVWHARLHYYGLLGYELVRTIDVQRFDVIIAIHEQVPEVAACWLWLSERLKGKKLSDRMVTIIASSLPGIRRSRRHFTSRSLFYLLRKMRQVVFRRVIVLSEGAAVTLRREHEHVVVIPNPVDIQSITESANKAGESVPSGRRKYLLFMARLSAVKRPMELLKAYHHVHDQVSYDLYIVGHIADRSLHQSMKDFIQCHRLEERVYILDTVKEPYAYIRNALGVILVSAYEGMPLALFEAMALRVPAISSTYEGYDAMLNDRVCTLFDRDSFDELCSVLLRLELSYDDFLMKTRDAFAYCETFYPQKVTGQFHAMIEEMVS